MMRSIAVIALVVALFVSPNLPAVAKITVTTLPAPNRGVAAAATGDAPGDGDSTSAAGTYTHSASSAGSSPAGFITADAFHSSAIPDLIGPAMIGEGTSLVGADATGLTGFSVLADSFFDVFFTVDLSQTYRMEADVDWIGDVPPFGGIAFVSLTDVTNSLILFDVSRGPGLPGASHLDMLLPLTAGVSYRLQALSHIGGGFATGGLYDASAGWSFILRVPEPASAALLAFGLLATTPFARRRRSR